MTSELSAPETALLAVTAGAIAKTAASPIERLKILITYEHHHIKEKIIDRRYKGFWDAMWRTLKREPTDLWRGNTMTIGRYVPSVAANFTFFTYFETELRRQQAEAGASDQLCAASRAIRSCQAGALAGASALVLLYPLDLTRTRLANDIKFKSERQYHSIAEVFSKTISKEGPLALWKGFGISCARAVVYRGLYFGLYETLALAAPSWLVAHWLVGWFSTALANLAAYPLDTVRRRMMMAPHHSSSLNCFQTINHQEGVGGLIKGAPSIVLRSWAPGLVLVSFEWLRRIYTAQLSHPE